ncbi:esterase-like activity of phytase family protein [Streptomyces sp. PSKA54]|uniref:Esterase-like activity of phytase family protein n=1 Tax=Streptomyces himalayensis subsp. aureolus TaxID=2758039 RepID=A0A7W2CX49_9ACTN|nr:esterase-like activity of phytase family protein [Streptomyces himalayensis]MBA4860531.1 esterase-like activity of phytase family protein [Streptomyces himalayensis subsp. aureolus]
MRLRSVLATVTATLAAATCLTAAGPAVAGSATADPGKSPATTACSPSASIDGYSDALDKTTYNGTFVGNFSALAVDRDGAITALSDRSQLFTLDPATYQPRSVRALAAESGAELDSEGLVIDRDGTRLVSSETEPSVRRYGQDGTLLDRLPVPESLQVAPAGRATRNATFEGLTLLPGGHTLLAAMEGSLSGDATGIVRLQTWQRHGGGGFRLSAQYGYRTDSRLGVSETTAAPDGRLLVLERGFTAGVGNTVRLYLADIRHATNSSGIDTLNGQDEGVRLARKTLLADLVDCPSLGATARQPQPNPLLDNIEGLAVTGRTHGGALRLLLVSDDNQNPAQITRFYRMTVRLPHGG